MRTWRTFGRCFGAGALAAVAWIAASAPAAGQMQFHGEAAGARLRVLSWRDIPFRTVVRQEHDFSCGSAALATLLTYHYNRPTTEAQAFTSMYERGDQALIRKVGFSMLDMKRYVESHGLQAEGYRMTVDDIGEQGVPVIVLIQMGGYRHFVVVKGVKGDKVLLGDPALGLRSFTKAQFVSMWNGIALALREDGETGPGAFNKVNEWGPWTTPPIRTAAAQDTLNALTLHLMPLYQITPVSVINGGEP
jgi:Predicted double-glycine peptidase